MTLAKLGCEICDMAILVIFGDKMANFDLIDLKIGLYIKVNVNERQNKCEVYISGHLAKMPINWYRIGQIPLWRVNIKRA